MSPQSRCSPKRSRAQVAFAEPIHARLPARASLRFERPHRIATPAAASRTRIARSHVPRRERAWASRCATNKRIGTAHWAAASNVVAMIPAPNDSLASATLAPNSRPPAPLTTARSARKAARLVSVRPAGARAERPVIAAQIARTAAGSTMRTSDSPEPTQLRPSSQARPSTTAAFKCSPVVQCTCAPAPCKVASAESFVARNRPPGSGTGRASSHTPTRAPRRAAARSAYSTGPGGKK